MSKIWKRTQHQYHFLSQRVLFIGFCFLFVLHFDCCVPSRRCLRNSSLCLKNTECQYLLSNDQPVQSTVLPMGSSGYLSSGSPLDSSKGAWALLFRTPGPVIQTPRSWWGFSTWTLRLGRCCGECAWLFPRSCLHFWAMVWKTCCFFKNQQASAVNPGEPFSWRGLAQPGIPCGRLCLAVVFLDMISMETSCFRSASVHLCLLLIPHWSQARWRMALQRFISLMCTAVPCSDIHQDFSGLEIRLETP